MQRKCFACEKKAEFIIRYWNGIKFHYTYVCNDLFNSPYVIGKKLVTIGRLYI
jgi:hypothetical protein